MSTPNPLKLFCWVIGENPQNVFSVKIQKQETVADLKKAIKAEKRRTLRDIDADALLLWDVSVPYTSQLVENVAKLELDKRDVLSPLDNLSEVFKGRLVQGSIHVVVRAGALSPLFTYPSCGVLLRLHAAYGGPRYGEQRW